MTKTQAGEAERLLRGLLVAGRSADAPNRVGGCALRAVERTRPARSVAAEVAAAGGADDRAALLLRRLTGRHLGPDTARWRGVLAALAEFRGSLPELLAAAPEAPVADGALRPPSPRSAHRTLGLLLAHAEPSHSAVALAALPEPVVAELLAGGAVPADGLVTAVVDHGDTRTRAALARHPRLDARVLARLVAVGDGRVAAAVYRNPRATPSLRRAIVARLDTVPLDEALRAELTAPHGRVPRSRLAPLLCSGDPQLVVAALRQGARQAAQQYALLRVWERSGPDAVRALLADPAAAARISGPVAAAVTAALAAPDGSGPCRLRARSEPYEDPARLPALLAATRGTSTLRDLLSEPYAHDLDALAAAHGATPFMPGACAELARHEAASDAQRRAFRLAVLNEPWRAQGRRAGNTTPPTRRLAEEDLDGSAAAWAEGMVAAGLLDPVALVRAARPAARALAALARLAERDLLDPAARAELHARTEAGLGKRQRAWAALDDLLPGYAGTLAELIAEAGRAAGGEGAGPASAAAAGAAVPATAGDGPPPEPPPSPRTPYWRERVHALAALDLLYALAPDGAPLPEDPAVLRALAGYERGTAPGLAVPRWFAAACAAQGVPACHDDVTTTGPDPARLRRLPETHGSGAQHTERAYVQGLLPADELLTLLPAHRLLLLPHDWRRLAFPDAWRAALARRLRSELGTGADAWLRLGAVVAVSEAAAEGLTWDRLLERARGAVPSAASGTRPAGKGAPGTPDEAIRLLERGNHLWTWPTGALLCLADAEVIDAVLPRLGPDGPWLLAAYLLRHDRTPLTVLDRLLAGRDRDALRVLAAQSRLLVRSGAVERLADLDDPEVDFALLRCGNTPAAVVRRIVARSRPGPGRLTLGARVLADWRAAGTPLPAGGLDWLSSAEADLVEELLARQGSRRGLGHQLRGCLSLFEHGGGDRLARLAGRGVLGRSATTVCAKALASDDPAAVLRARLDRELAPDGLVRRLRRARHAAHARDLVQSLPPGEPADWAALDRAHAREPLPYWGDLVRLDGVPEDVRLRHAALLPEPDRDGLPGGTRLTRERARHGLGGHSLCAPTAQLDGLLGSGLLDAQDLVRRAAPAAWLLAYLGAAARRTDAPPAAAEARTLVAGLVRSALGGDPAAWHRTAERLIGVAPGWGPVSTVRELLTGRGPTAGG
ncbi:hypothetical protein [Streptomyces sp. ODS05-4]|uniref:hypothetical protein n=1 Tax=Streptomyces sp. ODS05-4 TaxID=2944939 RepID=UPI00210B13FD|nr:hypothetical protein [Streptomyces sp. ODS05-4]